MDLTAAINRFHYEMALGELRRMHGQTIFPRVSYNTLMYLDVIDMTPDCTVSLLAEILRVSKSAVTMKVGELARQGLVEKLRSADDKRVIRIRVRQEVVREYRDYDRALRQAVAAVEKRFTAKEIAVFCDVLTAFGTAYMKDA